jgi:hypothetical protein
MFRSAHTIHFVKTIALAAALTAALAPVAQAADKSDAVDRYLRSNPAPLDVRSPDRKSPARQWTQPDAVDRALLNVLPGDASVPFWPHETGVLVGTSETYAGMRADGSYIDPSLGRRVANNGTGTQVDFRSADTRAAAIGRYPDSGPVLVSVPGGFDWGDATFGAGAAAAALLLASGIAIAVRQRKRVVLS